MIESLRPSKAVQQTSNWVPITRQTKIAVRIKSKTVKVEKNPGMFSSKTLIFIFEWTNPLKMFIITAKIIFI